MENKNKKGFTDVMVKSHVYQLPLSKLYCFILNRSLTLKPFYSVGWLELHFLLLVERSQNYSVFLHYLEAF